MRKIFLALMAVAAIALTGCKPKNGAYDEKADCIVIGNVITMDEANPSAQAVTVKNGLVQYVGSLDEARKYCDKNTRELDYGVASVYPGFIEGHVHGMEVASRLTQLDLSKISETEGFKMQDFLDAISKYVKENPNLEVYKGAGWMITTGIPDPTRQMLDAICDDRPMVFTSVDGHSMWINTFAMKKYGVDNKENIKNFGKDCIHLENLTDSVPTGYISEAAMNLVRPALTLTKDEYKQTLLQWQNIAFSYGITSALEAALPIRGTYILEAFVELAKSGAWKLRTYASEALQRYSKMEDIEEDVRIIKQHHDLLNSEYFKVYGIKIFMDGVVEAHTAWFNEPYADSASYYGVQAFPNPKGITYAVAFSNSNGMNAHFHSIGDAATQTAVKAIIDAQNQTGIRDKRNTIAHLQVVRPEDIELMGQNNIVAVVAPLWTPAFPDYIGRERSFIGDRVDKQYPIKSFFEKGCCVTFHSDYPVSPNISIPQTICTAVTRSYVPRQKETEHNIAECVTREQALKALTVNVAYQLNEENRLGKLKAGYVANMSVFDADFLKDDMNKIFGAQTVATIVDGQVVYGK